MNYNLTDLFNAPELYEQFANSPQYSDTLGSLFDEDEEERKRRLGIVGNYTQQASNPDPQMNFGRDRNTNLFNMYYL